MDVKFRVRIRPTFKFYAAVAFLRVERSHWLSFNQYSCFHPIFYRVPFNLSNISRQSKFNKHFLEKNDCTNLT